mgnify:CR=1 FL=1
MLPKCCSHHIASITIPIHNYVFRKEFYVVPLSFKCCIRENYVGATGPRLWNTLPKCIQQSSNVFLFRKALKQYMFDNY